MALAARGDARRGASLAQSAPEIARFREKVLVTHRGLSGPAILQISSYWQMQEYGRASGANQRHHRSLLRAPTLPHGSPNARTLGRCCRPCSPSGCRTASRTVGVRLRGRDQPVSDYGSAARDGSQPRRTDGQSPRRERWALARRRSRSAASTPASCPRGPWKRATFRSVFHRRSGRRHRLARRVQLPVGVVVGMGGGTVCLKRLLVGS